MGRQVVKETESSLCGLDGELRPQAGWISLAATEIGNALVYQRRRSLEATHEIAGQIVSRTNRKDVDGVDRQIGIGPLEAVVLFFMLVSLNREPSFEEFVIDGLIFVEIVGWNLSQFVQRLLDKGFFCFVGLVGVIIEQMIVAFYAVVDGFSGM